MAEAEIRFEREGREGVIAVGSYLIDAAKRLGIRFSGVCDLSEGIHFCAVSVPTGASLLTRFTDAENEYFGGTGRSANKRLACQARIERSGELVVMTEKTKTEPDEASTTHEKEKGYKKEFAELPLEKKIANLVELEAMTLSETLSYVFNSPFKVADKLMDVMAEFGFKKEETEKQATRPREHNGGKTASGKKSDSKTKASARKKPAGSKKDETNAEAS